MKRLSLGVAALVGASAFAACTVNFEGKNFCRPQCTGVGGGDTGSGAGGFTETLSSSGTGAASQGGGGGCGGEAVTPKNDDFAQKNMPPAAYWTELFGARSQPKMVQENGELLITPTAVASWFNGSGPCAPGLCGAPSVVQRISGNFTIKTHVAITLTEGNADPFAAAGIVLADPCDATKNNVVWDIGYQNQAAMGTDLSRTVDRQPSMVKLAATNVVEADLYACRLADQFYFYVATVPGVLPKVDSPDGFLQWEVGDLDVGLTAHVNGQKPVIEAQFHSVSFASVGTPSDCINAL